MAEKRDWGAIFGLGVQVGILCVLAWLVYKVKTWYNDESTRPTWLISILNIGNPVKYKKMTNYYPYDSNLTVLYDTKNTTANTCAANCSVTYGCNGIIWSPTADPKCQQVTSDFGTSIMVPRPGTDTYFKSSRNGSKWGFVKRTTSDYGFHSNVANQHYGTISTELDPVKLSNTCINQHTSNCAGFSTDTNLSQTWFIKDYSNVESSSNVTSYTLSLLTTAHWVEV